MSKPVTLKMIAERLGVSAQTVSNALQNNGRIADETAERVRRAAQEMGYRPNAGAQALRGAKTKALAFILCDSVLTTTPSIFLGFLLPVVASAIRATGYRPVIQFSETGNLDAALLPVRQGIVDGAIIVSSSTTTGKIEALAREALPLILFDRRAPENTLPFVSANYADGIGQAVRHVHSLGARRITYLDGRPHWPLTSSAERFEGFNGAMRELGLAPWSIVEGNYRFESGIAAFNALRSNGPLPDAVVCANDEMAVGLLRAAQDFGLSIPNDMRVTGLDDLELPRYTTPQLTSVRLPLVEMSHYAAERLASQSAGKISDQPKGKIFPTVLVPRASSAPQPV